MFREKPQEGEVMRDGQGEGALLERFHYGRETGEEGPTIDDARVHGSAISLRLRIIVGKRTTKHQKKERDSSYPSTPRGRLVRTSAGEGADTYRITHRTKHTTYPIGVKKGIIKQGAGKTHGQSHQCSHDGLYG